MTPSIKQGTDLTVLINIATNFFFSVSLHFLWSLVNSLQMILHQPMLGISFPQNVKLLYSILLPIASLDLVPPEYSIELIFSLSTESDQPFSSALEDLGYETHLALLNLGTIFLYLVALLLAIAGVGVLKILSPLLPPNETVHRYSQKLKKGIFFNSFILLLIEGFLEIMISCYLNIYSPQTQTKSDVFSYLFSYLCLFITLVVLPVAFGWMLSQPEEVLDLDSAKQRYGAFYEGVRTESKLSLSYHLVQMVRRLLFVLCVFQPLVEIPASLQLMAVIFINLMANIYVGHTRAFIKASQNAQDLRNEVIIFYCCYSMMLFTDFVSDVYYQDLAGWAMIGLTFTSISLNLGQMLLSSTRPMRLRLQRLLVRHYQKRIRDGVETRLSTEEQEVPPVDTSRQNLNLNILEFREDKLSQIQEASLEESARELRQQQLEELQLKIDANIAAITQIGNAITFIGSNATPAGIDKHHLFALFPTLEDSVQLILPPTIPPTMTTQLKDELFKIAGNKIRLKEELDRQLEKF